MSEMSILRPQPVRHDERCACDACEEVRALRRLMAKYAYLEPEPSASWKTR